MRCERFVFFGVCVFCFLLLFFCCFCVYICLFVVVFVRVFVYVSFVSVLFLEIHTTH